MQGGAGVNVRLLLGIVLLAATIACGWSLWSNRVTDDGDGVRSSRSDYVLNDFELTSLDAEGKESFTLRAPMLRETPGDRTMELEAPLFLLPDAEGKHWKVRSDSGWVSEDRKEIRLKGNVDANSPEGTRPVNMKTRQLNVFPNTSRASSPAVVTITQPGSILRGRGLEADLADKRYTLLSQVHSRYVR